MKAVEGWIKTQLGDVATLVKGISYASEDYCGPGEGAVFITIKCVSKAGGFKREGIKYFKGTIASSQVLQPGELLIANTDLTRAGDIVGCPMLVPTINGETITMSMDLSKIVEDDAKVDRDFLYYMLMTDPVRRFMKDHASGSTVLHLQTRAVPGIELEIPTSKPEQTKIADILSTVDWAIEKTEALIAKQQRIKTGLMQDLLTSGIDEHGNFRSEQTHEFKDSLMGRIPVEWKVQGVTDICSEIFLGLTTKVDYVESGVPLVRAKDINTGRLLFEETLEISSRQHRELTKYRKARRGDMLISKSGTLGICALVDTDREFSIYESIIVMQPNAAICDSRFLLWLMRYDSTQSRLLGETVGSTVGHLNLLDFRKLKVPLPSKDEQGKIAILLGNFTNNLEYDFQKLSKLKSLKTGLMQDLLTGKKRITALLNDTEEITS